MSGPTAGLPMALQMEPCKSRMDQLLIDQQIDAVVTRMATCASSEPSTPLSSCTPWPSGSVVVKQENKYRSYVMQRLQTTANHVLFYVIDDHNRAHLAIVGTDVRLTGHFVYCNVPEFQDGMPIRCTNRGKIMEWLAALGAVEAADPDAVQVPSISPQQLNRLLNSDPMHSKPRLDRDYTSWREESGRLLDGRHYKHFFLTDPDSGAEQLIIIAEDSQRKDRRYAYKAVPEIGGFAFENGQAVKAWLDFVVGRPVSELPVTMPKPRTKGKSSKGTANTLQQGPSLPELLATSLFGQQQQSATISTRPAVGTVAMTTDPEVIAALRTQPELLDWVTSVPDARALSRVDMWSRQLTAAAQQGCSLLAAVAAAAPQQLDSHKEQLLQILRQVQQEPMNLRLLDSTQIAQAIQQLCHHSDPEVANMAVQLLQGWQTTITAVLSQAITSMHLKSRGSSSGAPSGTHTSSLQWADVHSVTDPVLPGYGRQD